MAKHPGVPHAQFEELDPEFKAFMECRSPVAADPSGGVGDAGGRLPWPRPRENPLLSLSTWDQVPVSTCLSEHKAMVPGGALCCEHVGNLAACPRLWP